MPQKSFLSNFFQKASNKMMRMAKKIEYSQLNLDVFQHIDSLTTIENLLEFHTPINICDIGANAGDWTHVLHQLNPHLTHVVLFEPQTKYQKTLQSLSMPGVTKKIYQCALGDREDILNIKGGSASASLLDATDTQSLYFPDSVKNETERVEIKVLDRIYERDNLPIPDLIKLDVQGFELNVLKGAISILSQCKYLVIELSFQEFYQEQPSLWEILKFLQELDYTIVGKGFEWRSLKNPAQILQMDAIFMNAKLINSQN
jgi:FkbM family methyltransferase